MVHVSRTVLAILERLPIPELEERLILALEVQLTLEPEERLTQV
jgi:hypothetical protein